MSTTILTIKTPVYPELLADVANAVAKHFRNTTTTVDDGNIKFEVMESAPQTNHFIAGANSKVPAGSRGTYNPNQPQATNF